MDPSKRVQEAACSAFATIEEEACHELEDYLPDILETLIHALDLYQTVNLMILYDAIGTLADVIGDPLHNVRGIEQLILKLIKKWDETPTDYKDPKSKNVFALLECLATLFMSIGKHYIDHSRTVFAKSATIIKRHLDYVAAYEQQQQALAKAFRIPHDEILDPPETDFLIVGLDLLSGVTEGLGRAITAFIPDIEPNVIDLMLDAANNNTPEVRQSAFALMGDLTKTAYSHVHRRIQDAVPLLVNNVTTTQLYSQNHVSVCNNAIWALGEVCVNIHRLLESEQHREEVNKAVSYIEGFSEQIMRKFCQIITISIKQKTLIENTAITIGRLGLLAPARCSVFVPQFIRPWCASLQMIRDNEEKYTAFLGLVKMVYHNSAMLQEFNVFATFAIAVCSWQQPPPDLYAKFKEVSIFI